MPALPRWWKKSNHAVSGQSLFTVGQRAGRAGLIRSTAPHRSGTEWARRSPAVAVIRPQTGDGDPLRRGDHAGINVGPYLLAPILSHISYDLYPDLDRMLL